MGDGDLEYPVRRQLEAYNARDIEGFMAWWASDCRYYAFPDQLLAEGAAAVRARHVERFRERDLHGRLVRRIVAGGLVVDHEVVTRNFEEGRGEIEVMAIYEVLDGKIAQAWFRMGETRIAPGEAVSIREARLEDAAAIREVTRAAYAKWVAVSGREPLPMRADYEAAVRRHRFDLLYVGERLAALIETVVEGAFLLIENVAVLPEFQGRGFGRRLLAGAEARAAAMGLAGTRLYTNSLFKANVRLYLSLGYAVEREEALNGGVAVHMVKRG